MRKIILFLIAMSCQNVLSQELFVVTDPASNVPANSLAVNVMQSLFKEEMKSGYNYHFMPEVTYGLNKNIMFRASAFISNRSNQLVTEGGSFYTKYRFYSSDDLNSHFRMAAFGRYSFNNADIHQEQIEILGHNKADYPFPNDMGDNATNYTLSFGKLMYPKKYTSFKQTNINLMVEFVGQTINENGKSYLDVVPAIQFIFNSQARLDLAYRQELISSMLRSAPNGFYFNLYYTFFDLTK